MKQISHGIYASLNEASGVRYECLCRWVAEQTGRVLQAFGGDRGSNVKALISISLFLEYEAILKRPEQIAAHGFTSGEIDQFLAEIAALGEPVETHFLWRPQLTDAEDELVLEAAINGRADALITHNVRHFAPAAERFRMNVVRPADVLKGALK